MKTRIISNVLALLALGCPLGEHGHGHGGGHGDEHGGGHGDEHGGGHGHGGGGDGHGAVTRWTAGYELFVELDAPVASKPFAYHAHVTRLRDNHAATSGQLTIRFEQGGGEKGVHSDGAVARPGIFAAEANAPAAPGTYRLRFAYADGDERVEWDAGDVQVGADAQVAHEGEDEGEITFLKEAQWQIPFGVEPAAVRELAPVVEAAGVVRSAPDSTTVVAAPVAGLVAWVDGLPVVGREVKRGERLATLVPAGAAEHWSTLQAELATARIDGELARTDLARIEGLGPNELVSGRRLDEARAEVARADARVRAAEQRVSALTSGAAGAVSIHAPGNSVVVAVGAGHGEAVEVGTPLVSVSAGPGVLIEGRVHRRVSGSLTPVASLTVQRGDWQSPRDLLAAGASVLSSRLVYDAHTLSAPLTVRVPADVGLAPGDIVDLALGAGEPTPRLAVPRSAIIEINGQDILFVQKTGESFARRRVTLGLSDASHVEVLTGVQPAEVVVITGGFDVHVASLSGALESHRH
jgi:RND family efflux transporter MFP subunit